MFHSRTELMTDDPKRVQFIAIISTVTVILTLSVPLAFAMKGFLAGHH